MNSEKRALFFFICMILAIYGYGIIHDYIYINRIETSSGITLSHDEFRDVKNPNMTIQNRILQKNEDKTHTYESFISKDIFKDAGAEIYSNWYFMIEKPDTQYFEVRLNGQVLNSFGDEYGRSNIWNGTYFIKFNQSLIRENNRLEIEMYSDYMTGIGGKILVLPHEDYKKISRWIDYSFYLIRASSVISFFTVFILLLIIGAWHKELYNIRSYMYFLGSILLIGISAFDYQVFQYMSMDYLLYKKIIAISLHAGLAILILAISTLLNSKYKFNFGMINLILIVFMALTKENMIDFRNAYALLNVFLIAALIQLIGMLLYYKNRGRTNVSVMLVGFTLCGLSLVKLVIISNSMIGGSMLIDIPVMITIYVCIVLVLFYFEMVQMVHGHDTSSVEHEGEGGITSFMQGSFTIDSTLTVVGAYSNACDHIFSQLIIGKSINELFYPRGENDEVSLTEVLKMIFDPSIDFKEGFIALLPERLGIQGREYQVDYKIIERSDIQLRITLSDITKTVQLEAVIRTQEQSYQLMMNTLKSKREVGNFIQRTKSFINLLSLEGFTEKNRKELHTLKGNLGQIGFSDFEQSVHWVEDQLINQTMADDFLVNQLHEGLEASLAWIDDHVGRDYFKEGYNEITVSREALIALEKVYEQELGIDKSNEAFLRQLKSLRFIPINEMLMRYHDYIERLSQTVEKSILPFEVSGPEILVAPMKAEALVSSLVGAIRNAVFHGIESPELRVEKGKNSSGKISCVVEEQNGYLKLKVMDDGVGIDLLEWSPEDLFATSVSSLSQATLIAGRGIGLSALKDVVEMHKGEIGISSEIDKGTIISLSIPLEEIRKE